MADNTPNVPPGGGATPPQNPPAAPKPPAQTPAPPASSPAASTKPGESGKIQPKKETVRINLPPKPTAAPTIKIPAPSAISAAAPAAAAPAAAPAASAAAPPSAPAAAQVPGKRPPQAPPPAAAPRPAGGPAASRVAAPATYGKGLDAVDKGLAIGAAVVAVAVLVRVFLLAG